MDEILSASLIVKINKNTLKKDSKMVDSLLRVVDNE